jgi:hypothetical protein
MHASASILSFSSLRFAAQFTQALTERMECSSNNFIHECLDKKSEDQSQLGLYLSLFDVIGMASKFFVSCTYFLIVLERVLLA